MVAAACGVRNIDRGGRGGDLGSATDFPIAWSRDAELYTRDVSLAAGGRIATGSATIPLHASDCNPGRASGTHSDGLPSGSTRSNGTRSGGTRSGDTRSGDTRCDAEHDSRRDAVIPGAAREHGERRARPYGNEYI